MHNGKKKLSFLNNNMIQKVLMKSIPDSNVFESTPHNEDKDCCRKKSYKPKVFRLMTQTTTLMHFRLGERDGGGCDFFSLWRWKTTLWKSYGNLNP